MTFREEGLKVGDTFGDENHSYTVLEFSQHYMRVNCNKCCRPQSFHLDNEKENILKWKFKCCPDQNRYHDGRLYTDPMIFFMEKLTPGEILFERFKVEKTSPKGYGIRAVCIKCGLTIFITKDNVDLRKYVFNNIQPGEKLLPKGFCCRKSSKANRDKNRETAKQERLVKNKKLSKKGILKENGRTLYKWGDSYMDIHELSDQYGFSEQRIREVIKEAATTDDAISMIYEANEHNLDLGKLHKLIRGGKSLEEAVEKLESHTISRIAKTIEHLEITEDD